MGKSFSITAVPQDLTLEPGASGRFSVTVTNTTGLHQDGGRVFITPKDRTPKEWLAFVDAAGAPLPNQQPEEPYAANESRQYFIQASPAGNAKADSYGLRVEAVSVRHPNDVFEVGPELTVSVREAEAAVESKPRAWIAIVAVAAVILVGGAVAIILALGEDTAKVPLVANLSEDEAKAALTQHGLLWGGTFTQETAEGTEGVILEARPKTETEVDVGSEVVLVKAVRPPKPNAQMVQVTKLTERPLAEVRTALERAQLVVQIATRDSSTTIPENTVLEQSPGEGTMVPMGSVVSLTVESVPFKVRPKRDRAVLFDNAKVSRELAVDTKVLRAVDTGAATEVRQPTFDADEPATRVKVNEDVLRRHLVVPK